MTSVVAEAFHAALSEEVAEDQVDQLRRPVGPGPGSREINRALMLADKAKGWIVAILALKEPRNRGRLEVVGRISRPEMGSMDLYPAGRDLRVRGNPDWKRELGSLVVDLAEAVADIDTEASNQQNEEAFERVASLSVRALLELAKVRGTEWFVVDEANATLADLVALNGWHNDLGPRFDDSTSR